MREEQVTKKILKWLIDNHWTIVCFDFPQSGTGHFLHPNGSIYKNKDAINPDIVAVKNKNCVFFENKDRFYYPDYIKQNELRENNNYTNDINKLLKNFVVDKIYYGIGLPIEKHDARSRKSTSLVDFIIGIKNDGNIQVLYSINNQLF